MLRSFIFLNITIFFAKACLNIRDELCTFCDRKNRQCGRCLKSFLNNEGKCQKPIKEIDHCLVYEQEGKCSYCQMGYYTNSYGKCIKIQKENCKELRDSINCSICNAGILVTDGECQEKNKCQTQNCKYCGRDPKTNDEICMLCEDFHALIIVDDKINCIHENEGQKDCMYLSSLDNTECLECDLNFYSFEGNCIKSTQYTAEIEFGKLIYQKIIIFLFMTLIN